MASLTRTMGSPTCMSCVRALSRQESFLPFRPFVQVRGKKTKPNRKHMAIVKLQHDVKGFGPKGTIVSVLPGTMRNYWFPKGIAEYMTGADLTEVKRRPEMISKRNPLFDADAPEEQIEELIKVDTQLLTPQRSEELLRTLLPEYIEIFRAPISASEQSTEPQEPLATAQTPSPQAIYGSVSTQDILQNIKEFMTLKGAEAANADAGRVVVQPTDIKLLGSDIRTGIEDDRIKFLGEFEFELRVRGAGTILRKVRVSAQA